MSLPGVPAISSGADAEDVALCELAPPQTVVRQASLIDCVVQCGVRGGELEVARRRARPPEYKLAPLTLLRLRSAWVETRMCVAVTADDRYVKDTLRNRRQAEENGYTFRDADIIALPRGDVHHLDGVALLVGLPVGRNYFHWLLEGVARWRLACRAIGVDLTILTQQLAPMEREALEFAGVDGASIFEMPNRTFVRVTELWVPPRGLQGASGIVPEAVHALNTLCRAGARRGTRVFISRAGARRRRIAHEIDVAALLERHGFEIVVPEHMSIERQADLFSAADVIVAVHGAGLTNLVFATEGALVIELQPPALDDARMMLYWNVATARRLRYVQVICAEAANQEDVDTSARDIVIDLDDFDALLRRHLGQ